jgi:hypothetical protein
VIPLTNYYSSGRSSHSEKADRINAFLSSDQATLEELQSGRWIRIFSWVFLSIGVLMLLSAMRAFLGKILRFLFP